VWPRALAWVLLAALCVVSGSALGYWADDRPWSYVLLAAGTFAGLSILVIVALRTDLGGLSLAILIVLLLVVAVLVLFVAGLGDLYIECQDFGNCPFR
jgi:hypothetical protein